MQLHDHCAEIQIRIHKNSSLVLIAQLASRRTLVQTARVRFLPAHLKEGECWGTYILCNPSEWEARLHVKYMQCHLVVIMSKAAIP